MYIYFLISLLSSTQPLRVAAAHPPLSIMELGSEGSEHHGCLTWVASSKCLIRKPSGLRFFFCFLQRSIVFCPGLRMTYALLLGVVRMNGCITIYTKPLVPDGAARRCSELRLNLTALVQLSLLSRRSPSSGSGAGAEQWYKTIAKLMQGRNSIPHLHSEHRCGRFFGISLLSN